MEKLVMYLDALTKIQASGHKVDREIEEALAALRAEVGFEERDKLIEREVKKKAINMVESKIFHMLREATNKNIIEKDQWEFMSEYFYNWAFDELRGA